MIKSSKIITNLRIKLCGELCSGFHADLKLQTARAIVPVQYAAPSAVSRDSANKVELQWLEHIWNHENMFEDRGSSN